MHCQSKPNRANHGGPHYKGIYGDPKHPAVKNDLPLKASEEFYCLAIFPSTVSKGFANVVECLSMVMLDTICGASFLGYLQSVNRVAPSPMHRGTNVQTGLEVVAAPSQKETNRNYSNARQQGWIDDPDLWRSYVAKVSDQCTKCTARALTHSGIAQRAASLRALTDARRTPRSSRARSRST